MDNYLYIFLVLAGAAVVLIGPIILIVIIIVIKNNKREKERQAKILAHKGEWPDEIITLLLGKRLRPGMTRDMCTLGWGNPNDIQNRELTQKRQKTRWVYGQPRKGARYLYFTDNELTKIEN
jgi:hypothetical protein